MHSFAACLSFWVSLEVESKSLDRYARTFSNQVVQAFACFFLHFCVPPFIEIPETRSFVISPVQCVEITPLKTAAGFSSGRSSISGVRDPLEPPKICDAPRP